MNGLPYPRDLSRLTTWEKLRSRRRALEETRLGYLFAVPLLAVLVGLLAYPIFMAALVSLQDKTLGSEGVFVGLANYVEILTKDNVVPVLFFNTVVYAVASVAIKLVIGLVMAFVLNEAIPARTFFRAWLLIPWIAPVLVTALTWRWMFNQTGGVINYVIYALGLTQMPPAWLAANDTARLALIIANVWRGFPFFGITLLAGLQTIPQELYEAAEMDGATIWHRIRHIALPQLEPILLTIVILSTIWTFNDFTLVWVMTQGGPGYGTHLFVTYAYQIAFRNNEVGYASAISFVAAPLMLLFMLALVPRMWREEE